MPTPLTDADKVLRNDTGKDIVEKLDDIAQALGVGVNANQINYDNTASGLESENVQDAIDEVKGITDNLDSKLDGLTNIISTASGAIATFNDGGDNIPVKSLVSDIIPDSDGFTSVDVSVIGKNFYPIKIGRDLFADNRSASHTTNNDILSITMDSQNNSGVYGGTGTAANNSICQMIKKFSGNFVLSLYAKASADNKDVYFGFQSFTYVVETLTTEWKKVELPMTLDNAIHTLTFYNRSGSSITVDIKDLQIELGTTATEYVDYIGTDYTITLDETLTQGGSLNVITGLLTRTDTTTKQLTGVNISTLSGFNNIYSNTGDVEVEYFNSKADWLTDLIRAMTR